MKTFSTIGGFVRFMNGLRPAIARAEASGIDAAAVVLETEAKAEIGHYQEAAMPVAAWAPLKDETQADRARLGYPADEPLLRDGTLRDHITHTVAGPAAVVGVKNEIVTPRDGEPVDIGLVALWQEMGTTHIPPRSFLGMAAARRGDVAAATAGAHVAHALAGKTL